MRGRGDTETLLCLQLFCKSKTILNLKVYFKVLAEFILFIPKLDLPQRRPLKILPMTKLPRVPKFQYTETFQSWKLRASPPSSSFFFFNCESAFKKPQSGPSGHSRTPFSTPSKISLSSFSEPLLQPGALAQCLEQIFLKENTTAPKQRF